jgi:hypothetical protein
LLTVRPESIAAQQEIFFEMVMRAVEKKNSAETVDLNIKLNAVSINTRT